VSFYFVGPITLPVRHLQDQYIITAIDYLTRWDEGEPVNDCSSDTVVRFIFSNIISCFVCPRSLTNDQGTHFFNQTIATLTQEFIIQHHKSSPYHPQANSNVESFNKILENGLTKVCCATRDD
jgi:transposase InsO family protein